MENYNYSSYPESGGSSPRSREIDFENRTAWDEQNNQPPPNYKVKFMCSYGGKIQPRPHDNQLSYVGGDTKILSVDRHTKFSALIAKLASICDYDAVSFKYQLPGEDLDALISVTNDEDLEHMMQEYDRQYRISPKPLRLRLFLFPVSVQSAFGSSRSLGSEEAKFEKECFVEVLNSAPVPVPPAIAPPTGSADFLLGSDRGIVPPPHLPVVQAKMQAVLKEPELDPIQKHIQDLQRLQIEEQQGLHRRKRDDSFSGGFTSGEYYVPKPPEKAPPPTGSIPAASTGYWQEKQVTGAGVFPVPATEQPVYMIPSPTGTYPSPARPATPPTAQGYYAVQRFPPEAYREQPVYNVIPSMAPSVNSVAAAPPTLPPQAQPKMVTYSDGYGMVRPVAGGGVGVTEAGYGQVAYDSGAGRQVYYQQQGVMAPPPQTSMAGALNQGGKLAIKPQTSV